MSQSDVRTAGAASLRDGAYLPMSYHEAEVVARTEHFNRVLEATRVETATRQAEAMRLHKEFDAERDKRVRETEHLELDLIPELCTNISQNEKRAKQALAMIAELEQESVKLSQELKSKINEIAANELKRSKDEAIIKMADSHVEWYHPGAWGHACMLATQSVSQNNAQAWSFMEQPSYVCCASSDKSSRGCTQKPAMRA